MEHHMKVQNWQTWLCEADQYKKAGTPKPERKRRLSPPIVYNVYSMALESYVMAMLDFRGIMPENHTFTDLVFALDGELPLDPQLKEQILELEKYQRICSFTDFEIASVDEAVIERFSDVIEDVSRMAYRACEVH